MHLVVEGQVIEFISHVSLHLSLDSDGVADFFHSPFLEVEEGLDGEARVRVLLPVNGELVLVEAEALSRPGDSHKIHAHRCEVLLHSFSSQCHRNLVFADRVHHLHVLEEGPGIAVAVPEDDVLAFSSSRFKGILKFAHSDGLTDFDHLLFNN